MRVALLAALSLIAATNASAEWVDVAQSVSSVVYMDPATLGKDGNRRKAWVLYDFRKRADSGELSARIYREFDCDRKRVRTLSVNAFAEPMGGGAVLSKNDNPEEWQDVTPKTVNGLELDYACAR